MSRIDDVARGLALRSAAARPSDGVGTDGADRALERIARAAATPVSRRRALRVVGGALLTAALPGSVFRPARAAAQGGGCSNCGVEHGAGCVGNFKCGEGALKDEPVCCRYPGYFGSFDNSRGGTCAQAGGQGNSPPGGTACCCPTGYSCGDPEVAVCVCPNPCGEPIDCCRPDQACIEPSYGADGEGDFICDPGCESYHCRSELGVHCCFEEDDEYCCGTGCCDDFSECCGGDHASTNWCCPALDGYACGGDAFECGCDRLQQCEDGGCCPKGQICFGKRGCIGPQPGTLDDLLEALKGALGSAGAAAGGSASSARKPGVEAAAASASDALV